MKTHKNQYEVAVGNIGVAHTGTKAEEALREFNQYVKRSKKGLGRAAYEGVTLFKNGEVLKSYEPPSPEQQIKDWVMGDPKKAQAVAYAALSGLYIVHDGSLLDEDDSFPSGADYVDYVVTMAQHAGFDKLLTNIRKTQVHG